jgi:hypothetical protein
MDTTNNPFFKPAYTVDEFCAAHGIGRNLAYDEMKAGRLRFKKCGRKTLISSE